MRIATGMSLTGTATCYMTPEPKQTGHFCNLRNQVVVICSQGSDLRRSFDESELCSDRRRPSLSVEDQSYCASSNLLANEWLAFWLFLVASSYFLLRGNVNFFTNCRIKPAEKVSLPDRTIPNARTENDATAINSTFSCSESSGSCHKCDAYSEISDLDRASYWNSLLSLEEEDTVWLSDSKPSGCSFVNPSTPLSYKCDSLSEISDIGSPSYWDSLLRLEEEDTEWLSDTKPHECSFEKPSTPLSYKCESLSEISDICSLSYWDSLLSLEEEDTEWLLDSKPRGCSFENPLSEISDNSSSYWDSLLRLEEEDTELLLDSKLSGCSFENSSTPLSYKCDSLSEISDIGSPSYWDRASYWNSLLSLEEEDTEWLSGSKPHGCSFESPSTPLSYKCDSLSEISDIGSPTYWDSLLRLEEKDTEWISDSKQELDYVQDGSPSPSYKGSWGVEVLPSVSTVSSLTTRVHCNRSEDNISAEHLSETTDTEEFSADDEPLFWPFEGEINWNSEESWSSFCSSPRRRFVFDSRSPASRIKECKQEGGDAVSSVKSETSRFSMWSKSSAKIVPLECTEDEDNFASSKDLPLGWEYFDFDQELPIETLVGLKEFDGHEGLDSEFNGHVFMLD